MKFIETRNDMAEKKQEWNRGPWDKEPDYAYWQDETTGLDCLIVRNRQGALCGYVGVPSGHPWHGVDYNELHPEVHGGLTYASECSEPICHAVAHDEGETTWWVGFDCAHAWDSTPYSKTQGYECGDETYRDIEYVVTQCQGLAGQAAAA